ncbi:hypothetical protein [Natrinema sp. 1APR25-10V2]|uniref:hypothetical protein n=1 Tax=Natrinema sp. 1APR25-10V2 TaxID=2951081 RepID=UPI002874EFF8|nr:hypothetical protein [Natrinema sp. 1APR25-10V2]MDS0478606.1 hypothetical protein [Natrinema sp. 1APR25-10V2]
MVRRADRRPDRLDVTLEDGQRRVQFVAEVADTPVGGEREVARSSAVVDFDRRTESRIERPAFPVEFVAFDAIDAEIGDEDGPVVGSGNDRVGMWTRLPLRVNARARVFGYVRRRSETAIGLDREGGDAAARIMSNENEAAARVDGEVTGASVAARLPVQPLAGAGFPIEFERDDGSVGRLGNRVQNVPIGVEGQKRRVLRSGDVAVNRFVPVDVLTRESCRAVARVRADERDE